MPQKNDREYRAFEIRAEENDEKKTVRGYATTFNSPYVLYSDEDVEIREIINEGAFDDCDLSDVIMQYNHEGRVFARNSNGTLQLTIDKPNGLLINADLGGTDLGSQVYEEIKGGYTDKMSMGFKVDRSADVWTRETIDGKEIETREINRITKLFDVSAVSIPANNQTSIEAVSVRALVNGVIDEIRAERLKAEELSLKRKRAALKARMMED